MAGCSASLPEAHTHTHARTGFIFTIIILIIIVLLSFDISGTFASIGVQLHTHKEHHHHFFCHATTLIKARLHHLWHHYCHILHHHHHYSSSSLRPSSYSPCSTVTLLFFIIISITAAIIIRSATVITVDLLCPAGSIQQAAVELPSVPLHAGPPSSVSTDNRSRTGTHFMVQGRRTSSTHTHTLVGTSQHFHHLFWWHQFRER